MKKLFLKLQENDYEVHNKRLLGNPAYTSKETREKDFIMEFGLICNWFIITYNVYIWIESIKKFNSNEIIFYGYSKQYLNDKISYKSTLAFNSNIDAMVNIINKNLNEDKINKSL